MLPIQALPLPTQHHVQVQQSASRPGTRGLRARTRACTECRLNKRSRKRTARTPSLTIILDAYLQWQLVNDTGNAGVYQCHSAHQTWLYGTIYLESHTNVRHSGAGGVHRAWCSCGLGAGLGRPGCGALPLAFRRLLLIC